MKLLNLIHSLIVVTAIILSPILSISQDLQTYDGDFKHGHAKYTYYKNAEYERVYHGKFYYESEVLAGKKIIKGQYNHGVKYGEW